MFFPALPINIAKSSGMRKGNVWEATTGRNRKVQAQAISEFLSYE
jgi:hypothetical protein